MDARTFSGIHAQIVGKRNALSLPESDMLKLLESETGARELKRKPADGLQADMIRAANKYIPKLSDDEKQQVLEES